MSKSKVRILVACGSGVATSTVAKNAVSEIAAKNNIPVEIIKCTIAEVPSRQADVDVVLTTANYRRPLDKPYMSVFGLISGVGAAQAEKKLTALLKQVYEED
jgi:PTS system galactitol-specific IIB component